MIGRHVWTRSNFFFSVCCCCGFSSCCEFTKFFIKCSFNLVVFDLLKKIASSKWRFHWYILKWSLSALKLNSRRVSVSKDDGSSYFVGLLYLIFCFLTCHSVRFWGFLSNNSFFIQKAVDIGWFIIVQKGMVFGPFCREICDLASKFLEDLSELGSIFWSVWEPFWNT